MAPKKSYVPCTVRQPGEEDLEVPDLELAIQFMKRAVGKVDIFVDQTLVLSKGAFQGRSMIHG